MSQTKTGLIFLIVITLMRLDILAGNLDCEVNGRIQHTSYNTEGGQDRVQRMNFKLWIREGEWAIRVVPKDELNSSSISEYYECGFDGLNTYRVLLFNTNYNNNLSVQRELKKIQSSFTITNDAYRKDGDRESSVVVEKLFSNALVVNQKRLQPINKAIGEVRRSDYPRWNPGDPSGVIWFAYCSDSFISANGLDRMPCVWDCNDPRQISTNFYCRAKIVRNSAAPQVLGGAFFIRDTSVFNNVALDGEFTNAIYSINGVTNFAGNFFPLSFSLQVYSHLGNKKNGFVLTLTEQFDGITENIATPSKRLTMPPMLPAETLIQDETLAVVGQNGKAQYLSPAGPWPISTNLSELKKHQLEVLATLNKPSSKQGKYRLVLLAIFSLLGVFALLSVFKLAGTTSKTTNEKQHT